VLLDVVYNHLGPDGNYLGELGPYFTDRHHTPWGPAINLDGPGSDEVRRFLVDNALAWLRDYRLDGLRLDAVHALHDESATHLLEELAVAVAALATAEARPLVLIAESDQNDPRLVRPRALGGHGLDAVWADDFHHAVHALVTGEQAGYYRDYGASTHVTDALRRGFVHDGRYSPFRRRRHGRPLGEVGGAHLVACLQNHDQVGNRARGERLGHLVSPGLAHAAAALLFTAPMVPMLFQGEEWSASAPFLYFTDHESPELAEAVRRGRREEHGHAAGLRAEEVPDPQDPATYHRSQLAWDERLGGRHAATLAWYRALARLRRGRPELLDGRFDRVRAEAFDRAVVVERGGVTVVANLGGEPVEVVRPAGVLALGEAAASGDRVRVPGEAAAIWTA
jgi:maltooligosyltrehalose trehalohydrolase